MTTRMPGRRWIAALAGAVTACAVLATAPAAFAGVGLTFSPDIPTPPSTLTVGQTGVAASLTIANASNGTEALATITLSQIALVPSCGQSAGADCLASFEDPGVFKLSATGSGRTGTGCATRTFTITPVGDLQEKYNLLPDQAVVLAPANPGGPTASCTIDFTVDVLKVPAIDASEVPAGQQTLALGSATGTPDIGLPASSFGSGFATVDKGTLPLVAQVSPASITLGQPFNATSTLGPKSAGAATPTGTVELDVYGPNDALCLSPVQFGSPKPLPASGIVVSDDFVAPQPGTYRVIARYASGPDANYNPTQSGCLDPTAVVAVKRSLPIGTQVSPASITLGQTFADTATLGTPPGGAPVATGVVRFDVFGPADPTCAGPAVLVSTNALDAAGTTAVSDQLRPATAGTHRVVATYLGDQNYVSVASACADPAEAVAVTAPVVPPPPPATPALTTVASPGVALGATISDTATLTGLVNPIAGATVRFQLFEPGDVACTGTLVATSTATVSAAGTATAQPFTTTHAGTYRWRAFYSGDANNNAVSGACNAPNENVVVTSPRAPEIVSATFASPPVVGRPAHLVVRASDPVLPISGLQVLFGESKALEGETACHVRSLGLSLKPVLLDLAYVFQTPGRHLVTIVVLTGDCTGALIRTTTTISVDVGPAPATRSTLRAASRGGSIVARAAATAASCKNRFLAPTSTLSRVKVASAILCLVNVERGKRGRKKLLRSPRLQLASNAHSSDMIRRKYFEHEKVPGGPKLTQRLRKVGYRGGTYAENIGYGSSFNATLMVAAWMHSPGHKANILHPRLRFAGVGINAAIPVSPQKPGSTYTMDFGATLK
jgi:uncharacterized protein YkwD